MKELAVTFGNAGSLSGVLTEADSAKSLPCILILNAGVVHHAGPGRLGVEIARQFADIGFTSLRFDFSGIGDSAPRVPPLDPVACGIADVQDAMDHLGAVHGINRFIVFGLCSGARHAHYIAIADSRIVGAVLLDGYAYPTLRSKLMEVCSKFEQPLELVAKVGRRISRMISAKPAKVPVSSDNDGEAFFPKDPTREKMASDLASLAARDVSLLCVYSGEWQSYRYEGQLRDAFGEVKFGARLTERLIPSADHLYFTRPERREMLATVTSWLKDRFN